MKPFILFLGAFLILAQVKSSTGQSCSNDSLQLLSQSPVTGILPLSIVADRTNKPFFYLAADNGGLQVYNATNLQTPSLVKTLPVDSFNLLSVMSLTQQGNYLYAALGNFFGSSTQKYGLSIIDISDPSLPVITNTWVSDSIVKGAAGITVDGNYAYLCAMTAGLNIFNVSDKKHIVRLSKYIPDPDFPLSNPSASQMPNARGVAIQQNTAFLCYDAGGFRVIDISDKSHPHEISRYINSALNGKQQAYNNITIHQGLAYVAIDYCGLEVLDISNINAIAQKGWWNPWGCDKPSNIWLNSAGECNQLIYDSSRQVVLLSCGGSQLRLADASNPASPDSCNGYGQYSDKQGCWGIDEFQNHIYLAYITSLIPFLSNWAGIKILDWKLATEAPLTLNKADALYCSPNPSLTETTIHFSLAKAQHIKVSLFNLLGQPIETLANGYFNGGDNIIKLNESFLPNGIYLLQLRSDSGLMTTKIVKGE